VSCGLHAAQSLSSGVEAKYLIYHGFQFLLLDGSAHHLKIRARSHINPAQANLFV
jgi:hypothetical protein